MIESNSECENIGVPCDSHETCSGAESSSDVSDFESSDVLLVRSKVKIDMENIQAGVAFQSQDDRKRVMDLHCKCKGKKIKLKVTQAVIRESSFKDNSCLSQWTVEEIKS